MIIQCPSCNSRFSIDASKINSPLMKGRCSVCGHVFALLDHAVDEVEAAELRDRLERDRAERAKQALGGVSGVYGDFEEKAPEETPRKAEEAAVFLEQGSEEKEETFLAEEGGLETEESDEKVAASFMDEWPVEEEFEESEETVGEEGVLEEEATLWEEESGLEEEVIKESEEEVTESFELEEFGETPEESEEEERIAVEKDLETFELEEPKEGEEVGEWPPPADILEEDLKEEPKEKETVVPAESGEETEEEEEEEFFGLPEKGLAETLEGERKRSPFMMGLLVILIILALGGGGWYLYRSGFGGIGEKISEKISALRGQTALMLFDLKNEQEPAADGRFFVVRGYVQNKRDKAFPYITLRIKIYDAKNNVILTKQTIAGRVLKADEISKMTVQDALKQYSVMNEMNKKSAGKLAPKQKLPFLFLFDLSKFPRNRAKTFQVEILNPVK